MVWHGMVRRDVVCGVVWSGLVWCGLVWYGVVWSGVVRGVYIHTNTHTWVDMRWTLVVMRWIWLEMGRTCGGHWWTWGGHAVDIGGHATNLRGISPRLLLRCHRRGADAVHFASVTCPRCVHIVSMSDDSQITVGAQSELSQSYSQSSVRAGVFPRKCVFLQKSLFPLLLKRLGGSPHFHI